jgi:hypothetical protein
MFSPTPSPPPPPGIPIVPAPTSFADRQTIQLWRTFTVDGVVPELLRAGECAVEISWAYNKLWIGDGATNRLLLSSNPGDVVAFPTTGGPFLPIAGGTLNGSLTLAAGVIVVDSGYINLGGVTVHGAAGSLATDAPFTAPALITNSVTIGPHTLVDNGGWLYTGAFRSDWLAVANDATVDGRIYLNTHPPIALNEVVTKQYVDELGGAIGTGFLPLSGGTLLGPLILPGPPPVSPLGAVNRGYVDAQIDSIEVDGGVYYS